MSKIVRPSICDQADQIAMEILLPEKAVDAYLTLNTVDFYDDEQVSEMAGYFRVPITVMMTRLNALYNDHPEAQGDTES